MARTLVVTPGARRLLRTLTASGSASRQAIALTLGRMCHEPLPAPSDTLTLVPPGDKRCWYRRVRGHNLWLLFSFTDEILFLRGVTPLPPIPADEPTPESDPEPAQ